MNTNFLSFMSTIIANLFMLEKTIIYLLKDSCKPEVILVVFVSQIYLFFLTNKRGDFLFTSYLPFML